MTFRQVLAIAAAATAIALLLMLLLPLAQGPFSTTYGPATALRGKRAALLVMAVMALLAHLRLWFHNFAISPSAFDIEVGAADCGELLLISPLRC